MRIYLNSVEAIADIGRELKKCASTVTTQSMQNKIGDFTTKEIQAFEFSVIDMSDKDQMPNVTLPWLEAEFKERVSLERVNPGEAYKLRPEVWEQFLVKHYQNGNPDLSEDAFDYTYQERISYQLTNVMLELSRHPDTRQAIIEIHNNQLDLRGLGGKKRIPCSMFYQFMLRDGKLDVIYVMRSSDFATHFQNDMWLADEMRNYIAQQIGVLPGKFIMFVSSLHVYKKDWDLLSNY